MKKLLIHSNNTSLNRAPFFSAREEFVFDVDIDKDVDHYIDEKLKESALLEQIKKADIIFIKTALSQNYLEFIGLRMIGHIRLTQSLGIKCRVPILLIGEESYQFLGITANEPSFLFTKGIYLIEDSKAGFERAMRWYENGRIQESDDINNIIDKIEIAPPANHRSHHSITNEWSLLRWAKTLKLSNIQNLDFVQQQIECLLYYKFLKIKYPLKEETDNVNFSIKQKGKVLLIDDEWRKGWGIVFQEFFKGSKVKFEILEDEFKDKTQSEILELSKIKILSTDPDLIILDLRLSDEDFDLLAIKSLTGHMVLKLIKELNPGIQVILLTASNKIWNISSLVEGFADGYVLKESPELSSDPHYSKLAIENLSLLIDKCLEKSFLKNVFLTSQKINALVKRIGSSYQKEFTERLESNLNVAFRLLNEGTSSAKYFNYAYLQLFQIIEDFVSQQNVFTGQDTCCVNVNGSSFIVRQNLPKNITEYALTFKDGKYKLGKTIDRLNPFRPDVNFKVSSVLIFRYGNANSSVNNWTNVYKFRNTKAAHFNETDSIIPTDIKLILDFILYFIDDTNQNEANITSALSEPSLSEMMEQLTNKYKK